MTQKARNKDQTCIKVVLPEGFETVVFPPGDGQSGYGWTGEILNSPPTTVDLLSCDERAPVDFLINKVHKGDQEMIKRRKVARVIDRFTERSRNLQLQVEDTRE